MKIIYAFLTCLTIVSTAGAAEKLTADQLEAKVRAALKAASPDLIKEARGDRSVIEPNIFSDLLKRDKDIILRLDMKTIEETSNRFHGSRTILNMGAGHLLDAVGISSQITAQDLVSALQIVGGDRGITARLEVINLWVDRTLIKDGSLSSDDRSVLSKYLNENFATINLSNNQKIYFVGNRNDASGTLVPITGQKGIAMGQQLDRLTAILNDSNLTIDSDSVGTQKKAAASLIKLQKEYYHDNAIPFTLLPSEPSEKK